jgi:hypothetical protein
VRFYFVMGAVCAACFTFHAAGCLAQQRQSPTSAAGDSLRRFLQNYLRDPSAGDDKSTRYFSAFVDLSGDESQEVVVYITGQSWCGSGGCTTMVLAPRDSSYKVITRITITRPPIRILRNKTNGWQDIGVWVAGGGIQPGYEAELRFDGKTYPSNPSTPPARRLAGKVAGEVVVALTDKGTPLYQ